MKKIIGILLIILASGCSSLEVAQITSLQELDKLVGQTVNITTYDGQTHNFKVTKVDLNFVTGESESIKTTDIEMIETENINLLKTLGLSSAVLATIGTIIAISFVAAL
jgi:hypothetical protein